MGLQLLRNNFGAFVQPLSFQRGNIVAQIEEISSDGNIWPRVRLYQLQPDKKLRGIKLTSNFSLRDVEDLISVLRDAEEFKSQHFIKIHQPRFRDLYFRQQKLQKGKFETQMCAECGRSDGFVNLQEPGMTIAHWAICHRHKARWHIGYDMFWTSRRETTGDWSQNLLVVGDYEIRGKIPPDPKIANRGKRGPSRC